MRISRSAREQETRRVADTVQDRGDGQIHELARPQARAEPRGVT